MATGTLPGQPSILDDAPFRRAIDWLTASHLRVCFALLLLTLAAALPGLFSIGPVDRDEARFAQATRQMLETGDFVDIRLHDEPRYKKPVGIYWLQAAVVTLTGHGADAGIGFYRLASVLGAVASVLLLYWTALPMFGRQAAFVGAVALALSLALTAEAHLAKTDAVLLATVVLAQGALARLYLWPGPGRAPLATALLFWVGLGLGMLIKGPVILMVSGLTIAALVAVDRKIGWLRNLRALIGVPIAVLIVMPWFLAILSIAGTDFLRASFGNDLFGKVGTGQEGHGAPPGMHFVAFWFIFWPAVVLVPAAAPWVWRNRRLPAVRFCLAWIVPTWIVFELVATKLPHYTLPTYPAIAALVGAGVVGGLASGKLWTRASAIGPSIFGICLVLAGLGALWWLQGVVSGAGIVAALVVIGLGVAAIAASFRDSLVAAAAFLAAMAIVTYFFVLGAVLPALDLFRVSPRLAEAVAAAGCPEPQVMSAGYNEPSGIFMIGTSIRFGNGVEAADFLKEGGCRVALVTGRDVAPFKARAAEIGLPLAETSSVSGFNLGAGRVTTVGVFRAGS